mmetsp:Transcript_9743/g.21425  ORF Transcript_9743/g.21425 Transcript_9743/m.21425 type:complete len:218 (+) Transcript_9743:245-898(+)
MAVLGGRVPARVARLGPGAARASQASDAAPPLRARRRARGGPPPAGQQTLLLGQILPGGQGDQKADPPRRPLDPHRGRGLLEVCRGSAVDRRRRRVPEQRRELRRHREVPGGPDRACAGARRVHGGQGVRDPDGQPRGGPAGVLLPRGEGAERERRRDCAHQGAPDAPRPGLRLPAHRGRDRLPALPVGEGDAAPAPRPHRGQPGPLHRRRTQSAPD